MKPLAVLATTAAITVSVPAAAQEAPGGGYIGVAAGAAFPADDSSGEVTFDRGSNGSFGESVTTSAGANAFSPGFCGGAARGNSAAGGCSKDNEDYEIAIRAGYDWSTGSFVFGGLVEVSKNGISDSATAFSTTPASYTFTRSSDYVAALRARAGVTTGLGLIYGTAGVGGIKDGQFFCHYQLRKQLHTKQSRRLCDRLSAWGAASSSDCQARCGSALNISTIRSAMTNIR